MDRIKITDDRKEMESIGREIFLQKGSIYTDNMVNTIYSTIKHNCPGYSDSQIENEFYRSIYDYWAFGNNVDEEYFYHFYEKNAREKITYMTMRIRGEYVKHLNNPKKAYLFNDKYETYRFLGKYYYRDVIRIETENDFESFKEFVSKHKEFIVKPLDMGLGRGVHKYSIDDAITLHEHFMGLLNEGRSSNKVYSWSKTSAMVLEEIIVQDDVLAALHPSSVNAVRLTTVRVNGKIIVYYPWLKVGNNGSDVATAAIGGMDAGIDPTTGMVNTSAVGEDGNWHSIHPVSKIKFEGYQIPRWNELVELATSIALSLPDDINYIGWDFVLTKEHGWCIMEGNYGGEFMWQLLYGKGMRKEFEELIGWKTEKDFWWQ